MRLVGMRVSFCTTMRFLSLCLLVFLCSSPANSQEASSSKEPPLSAFEALSLLPPAVAKRIAIIEGRDGSPMPERWYLVVFDPIQEHRLMEYVVANHQVVAVRPFSQFARELSPEDIIRIDLALLNSDRMFQLVDQFARANNLRVTKINYQLKKSGPGSAPLWKITCLDASATPFAGLLVAANSGTIIQTNGFNIPPSAAAPHGSDSPARRSDAAVANAPSQESRSTDEQAAPPSKSKQAEQISNGNSKRGRGKAETRRRPKPEPVAERRGGGFFGALRRIFNAPN